MNYGICELPHETFDMFIKVKDTYAESTDPNPSYISSLPSPMRQKHRDVLLTSKSTVGLQRLDVDDMCLHQETSYNAWDEDIAVVNIFFGKETVMGRKVFFPHDDCKSGSHPICFFKQE